jgi:hypothetical protein
MLLFFLGAPFFFTASAHGEDLNILIEKLEKALLKNGPNEPWAEELSRALGRLREIKAKLSQLKASIATSYMGDMAGDKYRHIVGLETNINKDVYPQAMRFKAGTMLSIKNGQMQDEVTTLLLNLDYYLSPDIEIYGFIERFTDTFMSIKGRYETGVGLKWEFTAADPTRKERIVGEKHLKEKDEKSFIGETLPRLEDSFRHYLQIQERPESPQKDVKSSAGLESARELLEALEKERKNIEAALEKNRSRISGGMAISLFSEIEQAEIETPIENINTLAELGSYKYSLEGSQRFRIVFRPSLNYRVFDNLTLNTAFYFKAPLGKRLNVDGKLDFRYDLMTSAQLKIPTDPSWGGEASLILEYRRSFDNVPPRLPDQKIQEFKALGELLAKPVAQNYHDIFAAKISISF